jgi:hypothetical protein
MKTYWYPSGKLRKRIGKITDRFVLGYVELQDLETFEYTIRHINELEETR